MAGRPKLPTAVKQARGTLRKCRETKDEASYALAPVTRAPAGLNKHGKRLWENLSGALIQSGVLTVADWAAFEIMCNHYGRAVELQETIKKGFPHSVVNERGQVDGLTRQMNTEFEFCERWLKEFGLSPAARSKIGVGKKSDGVSAKQERMRKLLHE